MSGGSFEYKQYYIEDIADEVEDVLKNMGKPRPPIGEDGWYEEGHEDDCYYGEVYTEETIKEFKKAVKVLRQAAIYAQRIDWLLSGDDGEESFHKRLQKDLQELENKPKQ